jgi:hypothetical protein
MQNWNKNSRWKYDTYRAGNAWFVCDVCSNRYRRSLMLTRWDGLKVDKLCNDPRPPQMVPPSIYPEGMPFRDARPPQDNGDRLQDDTSLQAVPGGFLIVPPGQLYPNGQQQQPGSLSPQMLVENPTPQGANVLADDITFITGVIPAPDQTNAPYNTSLPTIIGEPLVGHVLVGSTGAWV